MSEFKFLTAKKAFQDVYLQFPKVLINGYKYKDLSDSAKIAYMVFKDRTEYSRKNNWIDKQGYVYFIFTISEICDMLGKSKATAVKIKKELEEAKLLKQVNMGFNKKEMKQNPNRLYLADLEVSESDIYEYDKKAQNVDMSEGIETKHTNINSKNAQNADMSEGIETKLSEKSEGIETRQELYKTLNDIKDNKDTIYNRQNDLLTQSIQNTLKDKEQNQELIDNLISEYNIINDYGNSIVRKFRAYSNNDYEVFKLYFDKLYFSHQEVQKDFDIPIILDINVTEEADKYKQWLSNTLDKVVRQEKAGKIKTSFNNYLFGAFLNTFKKIGEQIEQELDPNYEKVPMNNWLKETDDN